MGIDPTGYSGNVVAAVGIPEPDVELAKADLVARIHRLLEQRRGSPEDVTAQLGVTAVALPTLLRGQLATCSLDQLLRLLTWLGDDVEILIRPRVRRTSRLRSRLPGRWCRQARPLRAGTASVRFAHNGRFGASHASRARRGRPSSSE